MLSFNEERHEYRWHDKIVPSVTKILDPVTDFSMVPADVLERAREMGTAVHKLTELYDKDDLYMPSVTSELMPYLEGWQRFRAECNFVPATIEEMGYHPLHGYCGTWDRTGLVRGRMAVVDLKKMFAPTPAVGLQLAAYKELHNLDKSKPPVQDRYALCLRPDGTYRLIPYTDNADFAVFISLLTLKKWKEKYANR